MIPLNTVVLLLFLSIFVYVDGAASIEQELERFFKVDDGQLDSVTELLLKMKQTAHKKVYGNREFGSDAVEDAKKPVAISAQQPEVKKELSPYLFEGDIFLNKKQALNILDQISKLDGKKGRRGRRNGRRKPRSFHSDPDAKWLDMPIRYRFHESLEFYTISQVVQAISFWESQTCLIFENVHEELSDDDDYIEFFKGQGCYSMIGRNGGRQGVSIGENCGKLGIIEHEIGHALGLWHEQSRPDASNYVQVEKDFILPSYMSDFLQRTEEIDTLGIPYDLGSVMHYGSTAFSSDQMSKTLVTRDPLYQSTIGQRETLSFYDIQTINKAYCSDKCSGAGMKCENGGYPHPSKCDKCICPSGLAGPNCGQPEEAKNAECGGLIEVTEEWTEISSPDFPDPGYEPDQKCSWLFKAPDSKRIELEFIEDFSFLCTSTCTDYVELKIGKDLKNTGYRFCCYKMPEESFVSESSTGVVIFRSQLSNDVGFKLRVRTTDKPPHMTPAPIMATTTAVPKTISGDNIWSDWGEWSECSRSCGGCGIKSRVRHCRTSQCQGRRQEFSTCNLEACPVDKHCGKLLSSNRLCSGKVCTKATDALVRCSEPSCCPPFYNKEGMCVSDQPILSDFIRRKRESEQS